MVLLLLSLSLAAQTEVDERAMISFDKGLGFFDPDSTFGLNLRFRIQNRIGMNTVSASDFSPDQFEANVRRLRLRFDGYLGSSKLTYYLQLSFSRGDQDWDNTGFPSLVRDAMVFYNFNKKFYMGMGQGKLPGNRQRVTSSGQQQFVDRSLVNAIFNIDRDFGLMAYYHNHLGVFHYNLKGAVSTGEGRNIQRTDKGLAYTLRLELLPLGDFVNDGDFSEGDLEREVSPKLSLGAAYSFNNKAVKSSGQRGSTLTTPTDISSLFFDLIAKYQGWALSSEYANRSVNLNHGLWSQEPTPHIFTGNGINTQLSYVFPSYWEVAGRYTRVNPHEELQGIEAQTDIYTLGLTKYLRKHRNKFQLNLSYQKDQLKPFSDKEFLNIMFQVEVGI
ncbi:MAG: porin [Bacteroidales bacterium]|nr:porin [Bacteroidales bacterium]